MRRRILRGDVQSWQYDGAKTRSLRENEPGRDFQFSRLIYRASTLTYCSHHHNPLLGHFVLALKLQPHGRQFLELGTVPLLGSSSCRVPRRPGCFRRTGLRCRPCCYGICQRSLDERGWLHGPSEKPQRLLALLGALL